MLGASWSSGFLPLWPCEAAPAAAAGLFLFRAVLLLDLQITNISPSSSSILPSTPSLRTPYTAAIPQQFPIDFLELAGSQASALFLLSCVLLQICCAFFTRRTSTPPSFSTGFSTISLVSSRSSYAPRLHLSYRSSSKNPSFFTTDPKYSHNVFTSRFLAQRRPLCGDPRCDHM